MQKETFKHKNTHISAQINKQTFTMQRKSPSHGHIHSCTNAHKLIYKQIHRHAHIHTQTNPHRHSCPFMHKHTVSWTWTYTHMKAQRHSQINTYNHTLPCTDIHIHACTNIPHTHKNQHNIAPNSSFQLQFQSLNVVNYAF